MATSSSPLVESYDEASMAAQGMADLDAEIDSVLEMEDGSTVDPPEPQPMTELSDYDSEEEAEEVSETSEESEQGDAEDDSADQAEEDGETEESEAAVEAEGQEQAAGTPEIPEGVSVRKIDGRERWVMEPDAARSVFSKAELFSKAESILGEPLTEDFVKTAQSTLQGNLEIKTDLLSDDPKEQGRVIAHFERMMRSAQQAGEIGHDAMASFVTAALGFGLTGDRQTAEVVLKSVLEQAVKDTYAEAARTSDIEKGKRLWAAAQALESHNFDGKFRPAEDFEKVREENPVSRFSRPRTQEQPRPVEGSSNDAAFQTWAASANRDIRENAVAKSVEEALAHIEEGQRKRYKEDFEDVRDKLMAAVDKGLQADTQLQALKGTFVRQASRAVSPDVRDRITQELVQRHAAAAKRILREAKGPILNRYAENVDAKSKTTKQRVAAGKKASRSATPSGPPASRQLQKKQNQGMFESNSDFNAALDEHFA